MSLTVVFSTKKINVDFVEILKSTSGIHNIEILPYENPGKYSLTEVYNMGIKKAKNDIIIFCHDDIKFDTKNWGRKMLKLFKRHSEFGIIGVAGSRSMPESGKWWEDFSKMHGAVYHEHEGKRWLSRYSNDIGNYLDEVILVDGLFFGVHKDRISHQFNEEVGGFHFYDVDFSFSNHLSGTRVGVCTNIKITHLSIGQTNSEWEENRIIFAERYKDSLPLKINRTLRKNEKLNILIGCLNFNDYTGSELHVYELAKGLKKLGHNITICSNVGGDMKNKVNSLGIQTFPLNEPPGFKLGDGKTQISTPEGVKIPAEGQLYQTQPIKFDLMHLHHKPITEHLLRLYPTTTTVCTIHSEVIDLEHPVIDDRIKKYICIRPEIQKFITEDFGIAVDKTNVIYNPFDVARFKTYPKPKTDKERVLFIGTIDYLRQEAIEDLINKTREANQELWIVGKKREDFLDGLDLPHLKYFDPTWDVESYIKQCHYTAGILLGRTTIEGWLCGREGWIYDVDSSGNINGVTLNGVPSDMDKFHSNNVMDKILTTYEEIL